MVILFAKTYAMLDSCIFGHISRYLVDRSARKVVLVGCRAFDSYLADSKYAGVTLLADSKYAGVTPLY
jgi:hypothetical protein